MQQGILHGIPIGDEKSRSKERTFYASPFSAPEGVMPSVSSRGGLLHLGARLGSLFLTVLKAASRSSHSNGLLFLEKMQGEGPCTFSKIAAAGTLHSAMWLPVKGVPLRM